MTEYRKASGARLIELDGWRGFGCMVVVIFHLESRYIFWMWSWIDLFFVLSGFLISRIIIEAYMGGAMSLRNFWIRRTLRVWPVYYVVLLLTIILNVWHFGLHGFVERNGADVVRSIFYLQFTELYFLPHATSSDFYAFIKGMAHSWSLAVEEQFYLVGPLLMIFLLRRGGVKLLLYVALPLCLLGWLVRAQGIAAYMLLTRMDGLVLGVLLAIFFLRKEGKELYFPQRKWIFLVAAVVGLALNVEYIWYGYTGSSDAWKTALFGPEQAHSVFGLSLVMFAIAGASIEFRGHRLMAPLRWRFITFMGQLSYSLYVVHLPIIVFLRKPLDQWLQSPLLVMVIIFWLCIGAAYLSYRYIETPFLRLKRFFPVDRREQDSTRAAPSAVQ